MDNDNYPEAHERIMRALGIPPDAALRAELREEALEILAREYEATLEAIPDDEVEAFLEHLEELAAEKEASRQAAGSVVRDRASEQDNYPLHLRPVK